MLEIIETLIEEHRNIERLLFVLEQELQAFDRSEQPDYEILQAIIGYFQDYPEGFHHPKEDMVFKKLKLRDPTAAKNIHNVEIEHQVETERLRRVARVVGDVLAGQEFPRQTVHNIVRDFIAHQRQHMDKEERLLFPAAINALRLEDWEEIDARLNERKDPLLGGAIEKKYHDLRRTILRWEQEVEENRVKTNRARN